MARDEIQAKIELYRGLLPAGEWDDADFKLMAEWEDKMRRLVLEQEFYENPIAIEIVSKCAEFVKLINYQLTHKKGIPNDIYIEWKKPYLWLIKLLAKDYDAQFDSIEKDIDKEIESVEELKSVTHFDPEDES